MARLTRLLGQYAWILVGIGLLGAVYLLPPDTSLAELRRSGVLKACVPTERPPLVTADAAAPGLDVELLEALAADFGVDLALSPVPAMGQDFNPRSWHITRAQCAIIAGGVVASPETRSFLETSPAYAETGWILLAPAEIPDIDGRRVGVLATFQGFDRIALSRYLRDRSAKPVILRTPEELVSGLEEGRLDAAITEALLGRHIAAGRNWTITALPPPLERYEVVLGLWKGDLTLKRAVVRAFGRLEEDGRLAALRRRYLGESG
jgi:polar amino acid transport system substrate-binding protein/cystine transport system substrate-binding protein/membrane-bound lytic murein transglycosylase F